MDYYLDINFKNMKAGIFGIFPAALLVCVIAMFSFSTTTHAQCTNPAGAGGDKRALFPYSSVGATETVTIGNRGIGASPGVNGGDGGSSSFGSLLTAAGGKGGLYLAGGSGAGGGSVGPGSFPGADGQQRIGGSTYNNGGGAGMGGGAPSMGEGVVPGGGGQGQTFGQPGGKGRCIISTW